MPSVAQFNCKVDESVPWNMYNDIHDSCKVNESVPRDRNGEGKSNAGLVKVYLAIFTCRFECTTMIPFKSKVDESVPCDIHVSIRVHNYCTVQVQGRRKCTLRYSCVDSSAQLWYRSSARWTKVYLAIFMCRFECTTMVPFKCKVDESVPCDIHVWIRLHNYGTIQVQG